ncbi:MAG: extracellular solute-binding protein, partial [Clostridia bacterium]|nr:extracellular solute-binding protein [Clostridia bacterium]
MKKLVSLLLAFCLALSLGASLADDKVELTAFQYALENQNTDFNNLWFFDELEAKTNTHVTFNMVKDADWSTNVNLMFAIPAQMPDMILRHSVDVEEYGVSQGLLLPLDEYLTEEIMPNYVSRLNINHAGDSIPASDGHTYFIGFLMAQNVNHTDTWYVNQKELEKLGMEAPKTIEDVTAMLRAMKADGIT